MNHTKVSNKVFDCVEKANKLFDIDLQPIVRFDLKGTCTGRAERLGSQDYIRINPEAVDKDLDYILNNTVPHEVAHLVCYVKFPRERGHGKYWKSVCTKLGYENPSRCHNIDLTPTRKTRKWLYVLDCGEEVILKTNRHKKVLNGVVYKVGGIKLLSAKHFVREL